MTSSNSKCASCAIVGGTRLQNREEEKENTVVKHFQRWRYSDCGLKKEKNSYNGKNFHLSFSFTTSTLLGNGAVISLP